jgi:hypothetical protein
MIIGSKVMGNGNRDTARAGDSRQLTGVFLVTAHGQLNSPKLDLSIAEATGKTDGHRITPKEVDGLARLAGTSRHAS